METKNIYNVNFGKNCYFISSELFWRFRSYALENKVPFEEIERDIYEEESYSEKTLDSNAGDPKPVKRYFCIMFTENQIFEFWEKLRWFSWKK